MLTITQEFLGTHTKLSTLEVDISTFNPVSQLLRQTNILNPFVL